MQHLTVLVHMRFLLNWTPNFCHLYLLYFADHARNGGEVRNRVLKRLPWFTHAGSAPGGGGGAANYIAATLETCADRVLDQLQGEQPKAVALGLVAAGLVFLLGSRQVHNIAHRPSAPTRGRRRRRS